MTRSPKTPAPRRRTQQERTATTQTALLDATIDSLVEFGYAGTTTERVCARAGVTRGAHAYHFGTMQVLMARAIEHLALRRSSELRSQAQALAPLTENRAELALDVLWKSFSGPLFRASLEVWVAAQSDPGLLASLAPVERHVGHETLKGAAELFGPELAGQRGFASFVDYAVAQMRGLALGRTFGLSEAEVARSWAQSRSRLLRILAQELPGRDPQAA